MSLTSLQAQLQKRRNATGQTQQRDKSKASFLFEARQAADIDLETLHSIGVNGLGELAKMDGKFAAFHTTLFGFTGKLMAGRELLTREQNSKIDQSINSFLRIVSKFFLLKPAHKVLEYLIRRYRIHEMNVDSILQCILPYHSTNLFARMVQILDLKKAQRWLFLKPVKDTGAPIDRQTLVAQCVKDHTLIDTLCDMVEKAATSGAFFRTLGSFYGAMMMEILSTPSAITDPLVARILPTVIVGLHKTMETDFRAAACLALNQLCLHAQLTSEVLETVLNTLWKYASPATLSDSIGTMAVVCHTQPLATFPTTAFKYAVKIGGLVDAMRDLAGTSDISAMLRVFGKKLGEFCATHKNYLRVLDSLLKELPTYCLHVRIPLDVGSPKSGDAAGTSEKGQAANKNTSPVNATETSARAVDFVTFIIVKLVLHCAALRCNPALESDGSTTTKIVGLENLLRKLASAHSERTDEAIGLVLSASPSAFPWMHEGDAPRPSQEQFDRAVRTVLSESFAGTRHEPIDATPGRESTQTSSASTITTLAISLKHPRPEYRIQAITRLADAANKHIVGHGSATFMEFVVQSGISALSDANGGVAHHALLPGTKLLHHLPAGPVALLLLRMLRTYVDSPPAGRKKGTPAISTPSVELIALAVKVLYGMVAPQSGQFRDAGVPLLPAPMLPTIRDRLLSLLLETLMMQGHMGPVAVQIAKAIAVDESKKSLSSAVSKFSTIHGAVMEPSPKALKVSRKKKKGKRKEIEVDFEKPSLACINALSQSLVDPPRGHSTNSVLRQVVMLIQNTTADPAEPCLECACGLPRDSGIRINIQATVNALIVIRRAMELSKGKSSLLIPLSRTMLHLSLLAWRLLVEKQPSLIKDIVAAGPESALLSGELAAMRRTGSLNPSATDGGTGQVDEGREYRVLGAVVMHTLRAAVRSLPLDAPIQPSSPCSCPNPKDHHLPLCAAHLAPSKSLDGSTLAQMVAHPIPRHMFGDHWIHGPHIRAEQRAKLGQNSEFPPSSSSISPIPDACLAASCGGSCHWEGQHPSQSKDPSGDQGHKRHMAWTPLHKEGTPCGSFGIGTLHAACLVGGSALSSSSLLSRLLMWLLSVPHVGAETSTSVPSNLYGVGPSAGAYAGLLADVLDRLGEHMNLIPQLLSIISTSEEAFPSTAIRRALHILSAHLQQHKAPKQIVREISQSVPILLGPLSSVARATRGAALDVLMAMLAIASKNTDVDPLAWSLAKHMVGEGSAVLADQSAASRLVASFATRDGEAEGPSGAFIPWLLTSISRPPLLSNEGHDNLASRTAHAATIMSMLRQLSAKHFFSGHDSVSAVSLGRLLAAILDVARHEEKAQIFLPSEDGGRMLVLVLQRLASRPSAHAFGWNADRPTKKKSELSKVVFDQILDLMSSPVAPMIIPVVTQKATMVEDSFLDALSPGHAALVFARLVSIAALPLTPTQDTFHLDDSPRAVASRMALEALKAFEPLDCAMIAHRISALSAVSLDSSGSQPSLPPIGDTARTAAWLELLVVLELIQYEHISVDDSSDPLSRTLFELLRALISILESLDGTEVESPYGPEEVNYTMQLLLTGLRIHFGASLTQYFPSLLALTDAHASFHRCSENPQTHHDVISLVALLATRAPQRILTSLLETFTVLGGGSGGVWTSTIPAGTDTHWRAVLTQAIESAVPLLVSMNPTEHPELAPETTIPKLLFVLSQSRAFPMALRIQLISSMMTTVAKTVSVRENIAEVLAPALYRLVETVHDQSEPSDVMTMEVDGPDGENLGKDSLSLAKGLLSAFSPLIQLQAVGSLVRLLSQPREEGVPNTMFGVGGREFGPASMPILEFLDGMSQSTLFGTMGLQHTDAGHDLAVHAALKATVILLSRLHRQMDSISDDTVAKAEVHCSALLEGLSSLLPLKECVGVVADLLTDKEAQVVLRAFLLLQSLLVSHTGLGEGERISKKRRSADHRMDPQEREQLVTLLPQIASALTGALALLPSSQSSIAVKVIQLACRSLDMIIQSVLVVELPPGGVASQRSGWITSFAQHAVPALASILSASDHPRSDDIAIESLRCFSTLFIALKSHMVAHVSVIIPHVLTLLARGQDICAFSIVRASDTYEAWRVRTAQTGSIATDVAERNMLSILGKAIDQPIDDKVLLADGISRRVHEHRAKVLALTSLAAIEAFVKTLPQFVSPYLTALLSPRGLLHPTALTAVDSVSLSPLSTVFLATDPSVARPDIHARADAVLRSLAHLVPARVFIPALIQAYQPHIERVPIVPDVPSPFVRLATVGAFGKTKNGGLVGEAVMQLMTTFVHSMQPVVSTAGTPSNGLDSTVIQGVTSDVVSLFKDSLDYRRLLADPTGIWPSGSLDIVEDSVIAAAVQFIVKLTGDMFVPLFIQLGEWALEEHAGGGMPTLPLPFRDVMSEITLEDEEWRALSSQIGSLPRVMALYRLTTALLHRLKSIFVPYCAFTLDHCIPLLEAAPHLISLCVPLDDLNSGSKGKKKKRRKHARKSDATDAFSDGPDVTTSWTIASYRAARTLNVSITFVNNVLLHDLDEEVGPERLDRLTTALVSLLEPPSAFATMKKPSRQLIQSGHLPASTADLPKTYQDLVVAPLLDCLAELAVAARKDTLRKPLNYKTLMTTRNESAAVRLNAVQALKAIYTRLGEEWLVFLPESASFLSELLEDEDPSVEAETRLLVKEIEGVLGESLQDHLR